MEEYIGLEIEDFGIYVRYPEWWRLRLEDDGTYLFWDEYVGSFRLTPIHAQQPAFSLKNYLDDETKSHAGCKLRKIGQRQFACYQVDRPQPDGHVTRTHFYTGGQERTILACSFAYDSALLADEFSAEGVAAALEEVEILLEGLSFGEDD